MSATSERLAQHDTVEQLLALARTAHQRVELDDPAEYWYQLGQRNAYAHVVGLTLGNGVDDTTVADRIIGALSDGVHELRALTMVASRRGPDNATPTSLTWTGPQAFNASYGHLTGIDRDYGMRWGQCHEQRISLRRSSADADEGLLYAYDPTWEEYAVISAHAPVDAVEATFTHAAETDVHMTVAQFAEAFTGQVLERTTARQRHPARGVEL